MERWLSKWKHFAATKLVRLCLTPRTVWKRELTTTNRPVTSTRGQLAYTPTHTYTK